MSGSSVQEALLLARGYSPSACWTVDAESVLPLSLSWLQFVAGHVRGTAAVTACSHACQHSSCMALLSVTRRQCNRAGPPTKQQAACPAVPVSEEAVVILGRSALCCDSFNCLCVWLQHTAPQDSIELLVSGVAWQCPGGGYRCCQLPGFCGTIVAVCTSTMLRFNAGSCCALIPFEPTPALCVLAGTQRL
jgi:hypothetical protein